MLKEMGEKFVKYFVVRPQHIVLFLWITVLSTSALKEFKNIPISYFSLKSNIFNVYFVKWAWAWTLLCMLPYVSLTSYIYGCEKWKTSCFKSFFRIVIATILWYFWTKIVFIYVENVTGVCLNNQKNPMFDIDSKGACKEQGKSFNFIGFDISGHSFILIYSTLIIISEIQIQRFWQYIPLHAAQYVAIGSKSLTRLKNSYSVLNSSILCFFVFSVILCILWFIMLLSTCLYFHSFMSKAIGAVAAISSWMLTYSEIYPRILFMPGEGQIKKLLSGCTKE